MDRTKEADGLDDVVARLPVAYSQGYMYVSVVHAREADAGNSIAPEAATQAEKPCEQQNTVAPLAPPLVASALSAICGPMFGAAVFVLVQYA